MWGTRGRNYCNHNNNKKCFSIHDVRHCNTSVGDALIFNYKKVMIMTVQGEMPSVQRE